MKSLPVTVPPGELIRSTTATTFGSSFTASICFLTKPSPSMIAPSTSMMAIFLVAWRASEWYFSCGCSGSLK